MYGVDGVSNIIAILSFLGIIFGRVMINNSTFIQPEHANVRSANAVAENGTLISALEKEIHRTTAMGKTYKDVSRRNSQLLQLTVIM